MSKLPVLAGQVSIEIMEAVAALADSRKITRSQAVALLLAKATDKPAPPMRKRGRPKRKETK